MVYRMIFNQTAYFGRGAIKEIPAVAKQHGFTKAFIVTDPVLLEAIPLTLEEIFIYELGGADDAAHKILL